MANMGRKVMRPEFAGSVVRYFLAGCAALSLVGCTSGTLSGIQQSCESTFGLLESKKVSCEGSVDAVSGSPSLSVIEIGDNLNGVFLLEMSITVGRGDAQAHVMDIDDKRVGGEVAPGDPLRIVTEVYPEDVPGSEDEEKVDLQIKVAEGKEVGGLRYKATLVAQE
jgi:hypothetical protein